REAGPGTGPGARARLSPTVQFVRLTSSTGRFALHLRSAPAVNPPLTPARARALCPFRSYVGSYAQLITPTNVHARPISGSHHDGAMNSTHVSVTPTAVNSGQ